jgi:peroxiredoxin
VGGKEGGVAVSEMPKVGEPAPDIRLQGIGGKEWHLAAQRGRTVVLLFYVLDWTPG